MSLDTLFDPASIAVVGTSRTPCKIGYEAMMGVQASLGSVSPVADIDASVDLALFRVPAPVVPDVLTEADD